MSLKTFFGAECAKPIIGWQRETSGTAQATKRCPASWRRLKALLSRSGLVDTTESSNAQRVPHPSLGNQYWSTHTCGTHTHSWRSAHMITYMTACRNPPKYRYRGADCHGNAQLSRFVLFSIRLHTSRFASLRQRYTISSTNFSRFAHLVEIPRNRSYCNNTFYGINPLRFILFFYFLAFCIKCGCTSGCITCCRRRVLSVWETHARDLSSLFQHGKCVYALYCFDMYRGNTCWRALLQWRLASVKPDGLAMKKGPLRR